MFPPGLEPGTFRVLGERDNHYTTETLYTVPWFGYMNYNRIFSIEVMDPRRIPGLGTLVTDVQLLIR